MKTTLNSKLLTRFLAQAAKTLEGEWLLIGGTLPPAVGLDIRATVDIDLVGLGEKEMTQNLELMEISQSLGLPVETINSAAAFFLNKLGYNRKTDLLPLKKGKTATIYRPSIALYLKLKMGRLTETDLMDCQHYFHYCMGQGDLIASAQLAKLVKEASNHEMSREKRKRFETLEDLLS